jgi:hypothetical protein
LSKLKTLFNAKRNVLAAINYWTKINQLLRLKTVAVDLFVINLSQFIKEQTAHPSGAAGSVDSPR